MTAPDPLAEALANCDREPIHIPGTIQHFGALVATDLDASEILYASQNTDHWLQHDAAKLLGASLDSLLDNELVHEARNALSHKMIAKRREMVGSATFGQQPLRVTLHTQGDRAVFEFLSAEDDANAVEATKRLLGLTLGQSDLRRLLELAVRELQIVTGYDRVKAYRFLPDGAGEVVAESRVSAAESFLGLRFPASDIPQQARRLYATTPIRVIADVRAEPFPILAQPDSAPLDLSLALLRGTSPIHMRYLDNMGVRGTMTLPIVVSGSMWGLFALHHLTPQVPAASILASAELTGRVLSMLIQNVLHTNREHNLQRCLVVARELVGRRDGHATATKDHLQRVLDTIPGQGAMLASGAVIDRFGETPDHAGCEAVRSLAGPNQPITAIDDLPARLPDVELGGTAGTLIFSLADTVPMHLAIFRREAPQNVSWAGAPDKELTRGPQGYELTPRGSFELYREQRQGRSDEWTGEDIDMAHILHGALVNELGVRGRLHDQQRRLKLVVRELNHRVRNILSLVQSIAHQSRKDATSLDEFADRVQQRLLALADAHDLLTRADMRGVNLRRLAELELRPYLGETRLVVLSGPEVVLRPEVVPVVALVLHELTSNAAKYGALSKSAGQVRLSWSIDPDGLTVGWRERDGPPVTAPTRHGFGRTMIESAIPYEFGGRASMHFEPSGLEANIWLPSDAVDAVAEPHPRDTSLQSAPPVEHRSLRILIVEDSFVVAHEMTDMIRDLGIRETDAAPSVEQALERLANTTYDGCLLDVNLRGATSIDVARRLADLEIPFALATGYGSEGEEMVSGFDVPILTKPINQSQLRSLLVSWDMLEDRS